MSRMISLRQWRIVLDTSVLISALRSIGGAADQILQLILLRKISLCMDFKIACEYREVAMRPAHRAAIGISPAELRRLLARIEERAETVTVVDRYSPLSSDPADDMFLEVAINARVDAIVTHNLKHMAVPGRRFNIPILTPSEFLNLLAEEK